MTEEEALHLNLNEAVVWIDPLDGTMDFIKGKIDSLTTLIGVAIANRAKIGVIHKPYVTRDGQESSTYFGSEECGAFKINYIGKKQMSIKYMKPFLYEPVRKDYALRLASTLNSFEQMIETKKRL